MNPEVYNVELSKGNAVIVQTVPVRGPTADCRETYSINHVCNTHTHVNKS